MKIFNSARVGTVKSENLLNSNSDKLIHQVQLRFDQLPKARENKLSITH